MSPTDMRYWAFFAAKILGAGAFSYGALRLMQWAWPEQQQFIYSYPPRFGHDLGYTLGILLWFVLSWGLLYYCIWDQRYRCRVCLRKMRMPIVVGSWSRMLQMGRPEIEYICTYGHGKLNVSEVQISGKEHPEWKPQADMWDELAGVGSPGDGERRDG